MRKISFPLAALLALPAPATADVSPRGLVCGMSPFTHPVHEGFVLAEIDGGPLVAADAADLVANPASLTLTCEIHLGRENVSHAAAAVASVSASGEVAVVLPPTLVSYPGDLDDLLSLCTQIAIVDARGQAYRFYRDGDTGQFSASPYVACDVSISQG